MLIHIVEVRHLGGYRLFLRFADGAQGEVDISEAIAFDGVFSVLEDMAEFEKVFIHPQWRTLCWPGGLDLAPEPLYERATGRTPDYVRKASSGPPSRTGEDPMPSRAG